MVHSTLSDRVYQLLAHGRWFSPGTPASSTTKTSCWNIAEGGTKHNKSKTKSIYIYVCINNVLYDNKTGHDEVHFLNTLWKGSLNSDGQQFHQFQRKTNKNFSPQIIEYKNTMKYVVRNSCLGLGQAQQCCGVCMWYMQGIFSYFFFRIVCRCSLHILQNERICPLHSWSLNCFCHLSRIKMIFLSKFYF
jgi:hypothetical protein